MRLCRKSSVVGLGVVAAMSMSAVPPAAAGDEAPVVTRPPAAEMGKESEVPGHYIVVMKSGTGGAQRSVAARQVASTGGRVSVEFHTALNGFAAKLSDQAVEALRRNPHVQYVEPDTEVRTTDTQTSAPWGLDRVDQRSLPLNKRYEYDSTGAGVTAYIIDSGIRKTHSQFGGRVAGGFTAIGDGRGTNDCNGHGTHVAGTVGSSRYGVAKQVTLRPVRVLNCRGTGRTSGVIAGVDWVTAHHTAGNPAVANISIGGPTSQALDAAVRRSILDGVTYAVAAGNESQDACSSSPASVGSALTVGATTKSDARPAFSNTGPCVDLFAPGAAILSTWHKSNTATQTLSGTSMAAPHVAGAAALLLQKRPSASPDQVVQAILDSATTGVVANRGTGSPNRLLHSQGTIPPPPTSNNVFVNGGFEQGTNGWTASTKVITDDAWAPAHQGSWKAWLNGYGEANTNTLKQTVTLPAAGAPHLDFFLMIGTDDGTGNVYDTLKVAVVSGGVSVPLATYSNMDASGEYVERSLDLSSFAGQTVQVTFTGTEDSSGATSFIVDDVSVTTE